MKTGLVEIEERTFFRRALRRVNRFAARPKSGARQAGPPIRVGLIGVGNVARWLYLPRFRDPASEFKLAAVHDVQTEAARNVAQEFGASACGSLDELVRRDDIEAVFICTPVRFHCEAALAACAAPKHVLCEKPLSFTFAEAVKMESAARSSGQVSLVNFSYRFRPELLLIKTIVEAGLLGRIRHLFGTLSQGHWFTREGRPSQERVDAAPWKFGPDGGVLLDIGPHLVDLCRWWLGEVTSVRAWTKSFRSDAAPCDDACGFTLDFQSTAVAHLLTSRWATGYKDRAALEISGSDGALRLDQGDVTLWTEAEPRWKPLLIPAPTRRNILDAFAALVRGGTAPGPNFWDGLKNIETLEAIFRSARSDRSVPLPLSVVEGASGRGDYADAVVTSETS